MFDCAIKVGSSSQRHQEYVSIPGHPHRVFGESKYYLHYWAPSSVGEPELVGIQERVYLKVLRGLGKKTLDHNVAG